MFFNTDIDFVAELVCLDLNVVLVNMIIVYHLKFKQCYSLFL